MFTRCQAGSVAGLEPSLLSTYGEAVVDVTRPGFHRGRVPANKGKTYPAEILTADEVRGLLAECSETSSLGMRDRALITVLYRAGLRCAEALALRLKDVDLATGSVTVLHGKGDRRRTVGIDPGAARVVATWRDGTRDDGAGDDRTRRDGAGDDGGDAAGGARPIAARRTF